MHVEPSPSLFILYNLFCSLGLFRIDSVYNPTPFVEFGWVIITQRREEYGFYGFALFNSAACAAGCFYILLLIGLCTYFCVYT